MAGLSFKLYQTDDGKWRISQGDGEVWSGAMRSKGFDTFREAGMALIEYYEDAEGLAEYMLARRRAGGAGTGVDPEVAALRYALEPRTSREVAPDAKEPPDTGPLPPGHPDHSPGR